MQEQDEMPTAGISRRQEQALRLLRKVFFGQGEYVELMALTVFSKSLKTYYLTFIGRIKPFWNHKSYILPAFFSKRKGAVLVRHFATK
jgi:hypothetical protein